MKQENPETENEFQFDNQSVNPMIQKAESLNLSMLNEQESLTKLKSFLGPVVFDSDLMARNMKVFPPGMINILSANDYFGSVLTVECIEDLT